MNIIRHYNSMFFRESPPYDAPLYINTEEEIKGHLFPNQDPEQQAAAARLTELLQMDVDALGDETSNPALQPASDEIFNRSPRMSVSAFLQEPEFNDDSQRRIRNLLAANWQNLSHDSLTTNSVYGLILEHRSLPGWIVKKNYTTNNLSNSVSMLEDEEPEEEISEIEEEAEKEKLLGKVIKFKDIPVWMFPENHEIRQKGLAKAETNQPSTPPRTEFFIPIGVMNPFRVILINNIKECIRSKHLDCIVPCDEYIFPLPGASPSLPLHERVVVISKKLDIFNSTENFSIFTRIYKENPLLFKKITQQICTLIKFTRLTDMHIGNISFIRPNNPESLPTQVTFVDGEPLASLCDESDLENHKKGVGHDWNDYDRGAFSLVGLHKLKRNLASRFHVLESMNPHHQTRPTYVTSRDLPLAGINDQSEMIRAFWETIDSTEKTIIRERLWMWIKQRFWILKMIFFAIACVRASCDYIGFTRAQQNRYREFVDNASIKAN